MGMGSWIGSQVINMAVSFSLILKVLDPGATLVLAPPLPHHAELSPGFSLSTSSGRLPVPSWESHAILQQI